MFSFQSSKVTEAYAEFFRVLKKIAPPNFRMLILRSDMEAAISKGLKQEFGNTTQIFCQWHFVRTLNQKLTDNSFHYLNIKELI